MTMCALEEKLDSIFEVHERMVVYLTIYQALFKGCKGSFSVNINEKGLTQKAIQHLLL